MILRILFIFLLFNSCRKEETRIDCTRINSGTNADLLSIRNFNDTLFVAGNLKEKGVVLYSTDNSLSWRIIKNDFEHGVNDFHKYENIFFCVADDFKIFRSDDHGKSWNSIWIQDTLSLEFQTDIKCIGATDSLLYICGGEELGHGFAGVSSDKGEHWIFFPSEHELRTICFKDNLHGVCAGYGAIYQTSDGGRTWILQNAYSEFWTSLTYKDNRYLICSYSGAVMESINGLNWKSLKSRNDRPNIFLNNISANKSSLVAVGLNGKGLLSDNFGFHWNNIIFAERSHLYSVCIDQDNYGVAVGEQGLIYRFSY